MLGRQVDQLCRGVVSSGAVGGPIFYILYSEWTVRGGEAVVAWESVAKIEIGIGLMTNAILAISIVCAVYLSGSFT